MTVRGQVYKCEVCGNVVEVVSAGKGQLVCCGQPMKLQEENTVDASREKHVPVLELGAGKVTVRVGDVPHPMEEKHYIEWIEVTAGGRSYRKFLQPGEAPEATFALEADAVTARAYCNIHGLWRS